MAEDKHGVKIEITSNGTEGVIGKFKLLQSAVLGVRTAVSRIFAVLGTVGFVLHGVEMLINSFKKLKEWVESAANAARKLSETTANARYAAIIDQTAGAYKRLNKELAETLRLEERRAKVESSRKGRERDLEDAKAELNKQSELAALDVTADDYTDKKNAIERRYSLAAANRNADRASEDRREQSAAIDKKAAIAQQEADQKEREWYKAYQTESALAVRRNRLKQAAGRGDEVAAESLKTVEPQLEKLQETMDQLWKDWHDAAQRAKDSRADAFDLVGADRAAESRAEATRIKLDSEARNEQALKVKKRQEEQARARDTFDSDASEVSKIRATVDTTRKLADAGDSIAQEMLPIVERQLADAVAKATATAQKAGIKLRGDKATDIVAASQKAGDTEQLAALDARRVTAQKAADKRISSVESYAAALVGSQQRTGNRLTALGLGDGAKSSRSEINRVIDQLNELIRVTKENRPKDISSVAVFAN